MNIEIKIISSLWDFIKYTNFKNRLYKGSQYAVPPFLIDELNTFNPKKNPAYDFCESISIMAYRDGKPVGRATGIINHAVNERTGKKCARFGWIDFIDDKQVSIALTEWIENWAILNGMTEIEGPMGFTDMDPEGCLIEGFDQLGTMATIYNYPYYSKHFEELGYEKVQDWVEFKITVPDDLPEKHYRIANIVKEKYGLKLAECKNIKELADKYGQSLFQIINIAYDKLFGYSPLTPRQIEHYIKMYLPMLHKDGVVVVLNEHDEVVGVAVTVPSLSKSLQKSKGRIFPFGWYHLLKAFKKGNEIIDFLLIAVRPDYQSKGANALFFEKIYTHCKNQGHKMIETNPELDDNTKIQNQWAMFDTVQHKRRRAFHKKLI
ncbi:MAG: N-acetyltransferase [Bacteroidales bacterium]|nr:N-acetyltransferase [Bacteroidales bacterium]MBQ7818121.1 N-acetyltransferase [Bacteroidales bacterium]